MAIEAINSGAMNVVQAPAVNVKATSAPEVKETNQQTQGDSAYVTATDAAIITKANNQGNNADNGDDKENQQRQPSERTIRQTVSDINKKLNNNTLAEFGYHEKTNRVTIKIVDKDTKEVIKELPPEKTLDLIAKAWEMAGILVDEKR